MHIDRPSRSKSHQRLWPLIFLSAAAITGVAADETDPILQYYWQQARKVTTSIDPAQSERSYHFTATSELYQVNSRGVIHRTDSIVIQYFYTGSKKDSQLNQAGESERISKAGFTFPNIFEIAYHLNSFPNDTGGAEMAIGLIADSAEGSLPDGLVVIDRFSYEPRRLYLSYPAEKGYKRFTRSFEFELFDGYFFPVFVLEVGTRQGVFNRENYRMETRLTDIKVNSPDRAN